MLKVITLILLPTILYAQGTTNLPYGKFVNDKNLKNLEFLERTNEARDYFKTNTDSTVTDTIYLVPDTTALVTEFGFYGQDRMLQWFKAPSDLLIKKAGFAFYSNWMSADIKFKIVKVNYHEDSLQFMNNELWGYYEAIGNGYNDITAFLDDGDRTGPWVVKKPGTTEMFGGDIWDIFYYIHTTPDSVTIAYQWIDLINYPQIAAGEIFGLALKNTFPTLSSGPVEIRSTTAGSGGTNQYSLWKFYAEDPPSPVMNDYGWWSQDVTLGFAIIVDKVVPVENEIDPTHEFTLEQNYPNPFNPSTKIKYQIPVGGFVNLKVYDILGREVATLVNEEKPAGNYEVRFDVMGLTSGIYFYKLNAGVFTQTRKMIFLK